MNAIDILLFLGSLGGRFKRSQVESMIDYFTKMSEDDRCMVIKENSEPFAILTFSVCDDYEAFYKDSSWDYRPHNPLGKKVYIEFLVSKNWTKDIRAEFESKLVEKYPYIEEASWLRQKGVERTAKVKRRIYEKHRSSVFDA